MRNKLLEDVGKNLSDMMEDRGITSAQQLIDRMGDIITTRSINKHRGGEAEMKISQLDNYCAFFGCSADHMLGYIKEETHALTDIHEATGLSATSIESLAALREADPGVIKVIDFLLSSNGIFRLLLQLGIYYNDVLDFMNAPSADLPEGYESHWKDFKDEFSKNEKVASLQRLLNEDEYMMSKTFDGIINELKEAAEENRLPELKVD